MAYTTNEKIGRVRIQAIRMIRDGHSTRVVARHFGYGQSTIVKWWKRRNETWHQRELPTRSSRPKSSPKSLDKAVVGQIIAARIKTGRCAEVVHEYLKKEGIVVSLSSVKRVLSRHGMLRKRSVWKKRRTYPLRPDIAQPGDLVELDTIHFVDKWKKRTYVYTAIDVYSRYGYAMMSTKSNTHASLRFLKQVRKYFPFTIRCIQTDNGPEFGKFFTDGCKVHHRHNHPRSPNENGHLERFNRTLQEEIPRQRLCIFVPSDISKFLAYYNTERMHMGIQFKTPQEKMQEVIPRC